MRSEIVRRGGDPDDVRFCTPDQARAIVGGAELTLARGVGLVFAVLLALPVEGGCDFSGAPEVRAWLSRWLQATACRTDEDIWPLAQPVRVR